MEKKTFWLDKNGGLGYRLKEYILKTRVKSILVSIFISMIISFLFLALVAGVGEIVLFVFFLLMNLINLIFPIWNTVSKLFSVFSEKSLIIFFVLAYIIVFSFNIIKMIKELKKEKEDIKKKFNLDNSKFKDYIEEIKKQIEEDEEEDSNDISDVKNINPPVVRSIFLDFLGRIILGCILTLVIVIIICVIGFGGGVDNGGKVSSGYCKVEGSYRNRYVRCYGDYSESAKNKATIKANECNRHIDNIPGCHSVYH